MYKRAISLSGFLLVAICVGTKASAALPPPKLEYPAAVALSQNNQGDWIYKAFPTLLPLYIFDGDRPLKSLCDTVCTAVWPLLLATVEDKPVGDWTVIVRDDGRRQWAYKDRPVYMFYDDTPGNAKGAGKEKGWYYETLPSGASKVEKRGPANERRKKPVWRLLEP
jgi:predicted lipoprotein with Yx(FWY)xxD motif